MELATVSSAPLPRKDPAEIMGSLYSEYYRQVFAYVHRKMTDRELSRDITHDTFIKAGHAIFDGKYVDKGKPLAWLVRIAANLCMDYFRKDKKLPMLRPIGNVMDNPIIFVPDTSVSKQRAMIEAEIKEEVRRLLDFLPTEQREVVVCRVYLKMSFKDIAEHQQVSINTSLGRMRYALINLRRIIKENKMGVSPFESSG